MTWRGVIPNPCILTLTLSQGADAAAAVSAAVTAAATVRDAATAASAAAGSLLGSAPNPTLITFCRMNYLTLLLLV